MVAKNKELNKISIEVKKLDEDAKKPEIATQGSAGADLHSIENLKLIPNEPTLVDTGIAVRLPEGIEGQIRPRSSFGARGIIVPNSPGTIDWDYRGELKVCMMNLGYRPVKIEKGQRIAQIVFNPVATVDNFEIVDDLEETDRGSGGFGSTGE